MSIDTAKVVNEVEVPSVLVNYANIMKDATGMMRLAFGEAFEGDDEEPMEIAHRFVALMHVETLKVLHKVMGEFLRDEVGDSYTVELE